MTKLYSCWFTLRHQVQSDLRTESQSNLDRKHRIFLKNCDKATLNANKLQMAPALLKLWRHYTTKLLQHEKEEIFFPQRTAFILELLENRPS